MGAVLAMKIGAAFALLAAAPLAGCGTQSDGKQYWEMAKALMAQARGDGQAVDLRGSLTPEVVAQADRAVLITRFPTRSNAQILFTRETRNGDAVSWLSPSLELMVLERGLLSQTRGTGGDLMSADLAEVHVAIAGRAGEAVRIHRYLDGENHTVADSFVCDYARQFDTVSAYFRQIPATRIDETCAGAEYIFENQYWSDGSGRIVRSVQWVSEALGYVEIERLSD